MPDVLLDRPVAPLVQPDERAARRTLRDQVARLEQQHAELFCSAWPRKTGLHPGAPAPGPPRRLASSAGSAGIRSVAHARGLAGPRLLSLAELEELRDELAARVADARRALSDRTWVEEQNRRLIEEMLLDPASHKWRLVTSEDIGEPGCRSWHVRPRLGPLGMLMGWWRVVVSSGCPLAA